ncbi:lantibiotic dehydratase [Streptomyces sp. NPDC052301]|uniref:lantibiotic dehydratase n=1 Tax=Streptomyces sp. NPDC052301 TaxID=3365687 RepID=UPI0037CDD72E
MTHPHIPDLGTLPPGRAATAVAPVAGVRAAGLPVSVLRDVATGRLTAAVAHACDRREAADALAPQLGDDLYRLVPKLGDRAVRRAAVRLRRDIHNTRRTPKTQAHADALTPHLDETVRERLARWLRAMAEADAALATARRATEPELRRAGDALLGHLRAPQTALGLALASPDFTEELLLDRDTAAPPESRRMRSAAAYLARIAVKPSPFSTLTTLGTARFDGPAGPAADGAGREARALSSSRGVAVSLLRSFVAAGPPGAAVPVVANTGLHTGDDGTRCTLVSYAASPAGFFFRQDEVVPCDRYRPVLDAAGTEPRTLDDVLRRAPGGDAAALRRMTETGLLQPLVPWSSAAGLHFGALATAVDGPDGDGPAAGGEGAVRAVRELAALETTVETTRDPLRRARAVVRTRQAAHEAFTALGRPAPSWLATAPLYHEAVAGQPQRTRQLPSHLADDLAEAARWIAPAVSLSPLYRRLVDGFVRRHGHGAGGVDLLDFLYAFHVATDGFPAPRGAAAAAGEGDRVVGHGTVARPSHAVFFQVAAADEAAVAAGDYEIAVNLVQDGGAGLLGRWACVPELHDATALPLRDWVQSLHPGCRVHQVSAYPDWAELQRMPMRSLPRLRAPGDLPDSDGDTVDLTGWTLAHDPETGTLQARDGDGHPAAVTYMGVVPVHLLAGPLKLLCLLSDPWQTTARVDREFRPYDRMRPVETLTYRPRIQHGRLVWARARWSVPPAEVPRPDPGAPTVDFLTDVERWRRRNGIPREAFIAQAVRDRRGITKSKPQWIQFDSPHLVWSALRRIHPDAVAVDFVEAFPGSGQQPWHDAQGRPVVTEFMGLVRHG